MSDFINEVQVEEVFVTEPMDMNQTCDDCGHRLIDCDCLYNGPDDGEGEHNFCGDCGRSCAGCNCGGILPYDFEFDDNVDLQQEYQDLYGGEDDFVYDDWQSESDLWNEC